MDAVKPLGSQLSVPCEHKGSFLSFQVFSLELAFAASTLDMPGHHHHRKHAPAKLLGVRCSWKESQFILP